MRRVPEGVFINCKAHVLEDESMRFCGNTAPPATSWHTKSGEMGGRHTREWGPGAGEGDESPKGGQEQEKDKNTSAQRPFFPGQSEEQNDHHEFVTFKTDICLPSEIFRTSNK